MNIGVKMAQPLHFFIKVVKSIPVKEFGAVGYIQRTGDFNGRVRARRAHGTTTVKTDHHGFAFHNAGHLLLYIFESIIPVHSIGQ